MLEGALSALLTVYQAVVGVFRVIVSWVISLIFACGTGLGTWAPPEVPTVAPPQEVAMMELTQAYVIVTSSDATQAEKTAANELQSYLKQICGYTYPIVSDTGSYEKEIVVGKTNREGTLYTVDREALGNEGVLLKTVGDSVVITGGALRGTLYAVYTFLEDYLGCRWFTQDLIVIPEAQKLEIPKDIDYTHVPVLEYRETDWISPRDKTWSVANKLNGLVYSPVGGADVGGGMGYAGSFAHTMQTVFHSGVFAQHPSIRAYGIRSGDYTDEHPCLSQEKTYEIMLAWVFAQLDAHPDRQIVSVTHPDNQNYCVCEKCQAVYTEEGSPAGLMLRFVNRIADAVKERYPQRDIAVDTFAYQYTRQAPTITTPRDNVIVRLCSIECCFVHALNDAACERNVKFMADLADWSEVCNRLYIWDYTTNYGNYNGPFNNWAVMQPNMQVFANNHVVGIYEEGNYQASQSNGEFGDLRSYLLAKLLWDENTDYTRHMIEFCEAYYGDAAEYILAYLTLVTQRSGQVHNTKGTLEHMGIFENIGNNGVMQLGVNDITYINTLWEDAKGVETLSEAELFRVRRSEISWRYWKATKQIREFNIFTRRQSSIELYNDMKELGIVRIHEGEGGMLAEKPYYLDKPGRWSTSKVPDTFPGMFY